MLTNKMNNVIISTMELRSMNPLNGLFPAQSEAGSLRGFSMSEIWKDVVGYEGRYSVSDLGNIKNSKGKILKSTQASNGYLRIILSKKSGIKSFAVHRLVYGAFFELSENNQINHLDGNKKNNVLSNLEPCNRRENMSHFFGSKFAGCRRKSIKGMWRSEISIDGKKISLGNYSTKEEAALAYQKALKDYNLKNKYADKALAQIQKLKEKNDE